MDEPFILRHKDRLMHYHIHDGKNQSNHLALGSGKINIKKHLEIATTQNCRCVVETKTVAGLKESVDWLRKEKFL